MLLQAGIFFKERDLFQEPLSESELRVLIGKSTPANVFSWKSPSFKKLGFGPDDLEDSDLISLMLEEPRLIRRPLVCVDENLFIGPNLDTLLKEHLD